MSKFHLDPTSPEYERELRLDLLDRCESNAASHVEAARLARMAGDKEEAGRHLKWAAEWTALGATIEEGLAR